MRDRLVIQDAREQIEGEAIALLGEKVLRVSLPFVPPDGLIFDKLSLNRFLPVFPPGMIDPENGSSVAPETPFERYLKGKDPIPAELVAKPAPGLRTASAILSEEAQPLTKRSIQAFLATLGNVEETEGEREAEEIERDDRPEEESPRDDSAEETKESGEKKTVDERDAPPLIPPLPDPPPAADPQREKSYLDDLVSKAVEGAKTGD